MTQGFSYDDYENIFIHKAFKYHNPDCSTCVIPGVADDNPDVVDNSLDKKNSGVLSYRDMEFTKLPKQIEMKVCGVEAGEIKLSLKPAGEAAAFVNLAECVVPVEKREDLEFEVITAEVPESFVREAGVYELVITISGKVKLAEFRFV